MNKIFKNEAVVQAPGFSSTPHPCKDHVIVTIT
jgi:hypothetical protein